MEISRLKEEIVNLKSQIKKAQNKILTQETTIITVRNRTAKAVHRFSILQVKYDKLKEGTNAPLNMTQLHQDIAAIRKTEHDKPPMK
jgi:FtsZ-binding cell division protein ZapB